MSRPGGDIEGAEFARSARSHRALKRTVTALAVALALLVVCGCGTTTHFGVLIQKAPAPGDVAYAGAADAVCRNVDASLKPLDARFAAFADPTAEPRLKADIVRGQQTELARLRALAQPVQGRSRIAALWRALSATIATYAQIPTPALFTNSRAFNAFTANQTVKSNANFATAYTYEELAMAFGLRVCGQQPSGSQMTAELETVSG